MRLMGDLQRLVKSDEMKRRFMEKQGAFVQCCE